MRESTISRYSGNCDVDIDECNSSPCRNGGTCTEYSHLNVSLPDFYWCSCHSGFEGLECHLDTNECVSMPCKNGAVCIDSAQNSSVAPNTYRCVCASGYTNGFCNYSFVPLYTSACQVNSGGNCDVDVNECVSAPCVNGGTCLDSLNGSAPIHQYVCQCMAAFTGANCAVEVDECASSPCLHGGSCHDLVGGFACTCSPGCLLYTSPSPRDS